MYGEVELGIQIRSALNVGAVRVWRSFLRYYFMDIQDYQGAPQNKNAPGGWKS
jgi:hypothetical protein